MADLIAGRVVAEGSEQTLGRRILFGLSAARRVRSLWSCAVSDMAN